jgi:hypothetical protein
MVTFVVLDVSGQKILVFSAIVAALIVAAGTMTAFQIRSYFSPVMNYFRKVAANESVSGPEYFEAKKRFFAAPRQRAVSGVIAWVILMPVAFGLQLRIQPSADRQGCYPVADSD